MKTLMTLFVTVLVTGCATTHVNATVDSYSESKINKKDAHYFYSDGALADKQVTAQCKRAAIASGLNVVESSCKDCKTIVVKGSVAGTHSAGSLSRVLPDGNSAISGSVNHTERVLEIRVHESTPTSKELVSTTVTSSGNSKSVSAVAYEMCMAAFKEYPNNMTGKTFEIPAEE